MGVCAPDIARAGLSLSKSFEADAQSVTPQAQVCVCVCARLLAFALVFVTLVSQEALQWLYVHRPALSKAFNGQSSMSVDAFSKQLLADVKLFPQHLTQPLCRLLERWLDLLPLA